MTFLRSLLFALLFYPGTLVYVLTVIAVSPIGDRPVQAVVHAWSAFHNWLVRNVVGIRIEWDGRIPDGPYPHRRQASVDDGSRRHAPFRQHAGGGDEARIDGDSALRLGDSPLRRDRRRPRSRGQRAPDDDGGGKGRDCRRAARSSFSRKERRVAYGESPPLQPGFAGLYRALGLPVVPVAHDVGRLWHKGFLKRSGTVHFKVGEVIPSGLKRDEVEARVHAAINALNP